MGVRLVGSMLGPLVGDLVAINSLVTWAPPDLDLRVGLLVAEGGDVLPGLEGPGSSEVILQMAACASVKIVTDPQSQMRKVFDPRVNKLRE